MQRRKIVLLMLVFLSLTIALPISISASYRQVSSFDCGGARFVQEKHTKIEVLALCGEPQYTDSYGDVWIYNIGSNRYTYLLKFVNQKLERIEEFNPLSVPVPWRDK